MGLYYELQLFIKMLFKLAILVLILSCGTAVIMGVFL